MVVFLWRSPVTDRRPVQGVHCILPYDSWNRLQASWTLNWICGWMDASYPFPFHNQHATRQRPPPATNWLFPLQWHSRWLQGELGVKYYILLLFPDKITCHCCSVLVIHGSETHFPLEFRGREELKAFNFSIQKQQEVSRNLYFRISFSSCGEHEIVSFSLCRVWFDT